MKVLAARWRSSSGLVGYRRRGAVLFGLHLLLVGNPAVAETTDSTNKETAEDIFVQTAEKMRVKGYVRKEFHKFSQLEDYMQHPNNATPASLFQKVGGFLEEAGKLALRGQLGQKGPEQLEPYRNRKSALGWGSFVSKPDADRLTESITEDTWKKNLEQVVRGPGEGSALLTAGDESPALLGFIPGVLRGWGLGGGPTWKTRALGSKGAGAAARFIAKRMEQTGLEVWTDGIDAEQEAGAVLGRDKEELKQALSGLETQGKLNVLGTLPGKDTHCFVLLGAHYDTVNHEDVYAKGGKKEALAPGADDNGSGVATLLSAMDALSSATEKPQCSLVFAAFIGEEQGMLGSSHFVRTWVKTGKLGKFKGALILDMVGFDEDKKRGLIFETKGDTKGNSVLVDTLAATTEEILREATGKIAPLGKYEVNYHGFGSDHMSFLNEGLEPTVLLIERQNMLYSDKYGHSVRDRLENIDYGFGAEVANLAVRTVAKMAADPAGKEAPTKEGEGVDSVALSLKVRHKRKPLRPTHMQEISSQTLQLPSVAKHEAAVVRNHAETAHARQQQQRYPVATLSARRGSGRGPQPIHGLGGLRTSIFQDGLIFSGRFLATVLFLFVCFALFSYIYMCRNREKDLGGSSAEPAGRHVERS